MALSTCVKCGQHSFEIKEAEPMGIKFKVFFVQCSACGGGVGVLDYLNTPMMIDKLGERLGVGRVSDV